MDKRADEWRRRLGRSIAGGRVEVPQGGGGAFLAACKQTRTTRLPFEVAATGD